MFWATRSTNAEPVSAWESSSRKKGDPNYVFGDQINQTGDGVLIGKVVTPNTQATPTDAEAARTRSTLLLLMSNPCGSSPLKLDEEARAIELAIAAAKNRNQIELRTNHALTIADLHDAVLRHAPTVVHFSGHGSDQGGIIIGNDRYNAHLVPQKALADLFRLAGQTIRCVVLNACYTASQAQAISPHVPCVVGVPREVPDKPAIAFAEGFYRGLAYGRSVQTAFELGCNAIAIRGLQRDDANMPVLVAQAGVASATFITR